VTKPAPTPSDVAARVGIAPSLTLDELAALAGVSRRTIERRVRQGLIPVVRDGLRCTRVTGAAAAAYLAGETATPESGSVVALRTQPDRRREA
jgi:excisionase family DNA binding protein